jgi:pimeloyl-ACP methyl ester carboxylesterase
MGFASELRNPSTRLSRLTVILIVIVFLLFLMACGISSYLLYRLLHPISTSTALTPDTLLGHPSVVQFTVPGEGEREGWFFPGLRSAPVIILCHGYQSQRGDTLTLATPLQENQFNVFVFDFSGHGQAHGSTTLGPQETKEVLAAIAAMAQRTDVDRNRIGLWGANMGAYAALAAAAADRRIRALVVDSVYDEPMIFLRTELDRTGFGSMFLIGAMTRFGFQVRELPFRGEGPLSSRLSPLARVPKLFIALRESPALAESTLQLFAAAPEPKDQWVMQKGNYTAMTNDEKRTYENFVLTFFLRNLAPLSRTAPPR